MKGTAPCFQRPFLERIVRDKPVETDKPFLPRASILKPLDIVAILVVAGLVSAVSLASFSGRAGLERIVITGRSGTWIYPLDYEGRVEIPGPLGLTVVSFRGGEALIEDSPCPTKSCVQMGGIRVKGQWLACLPNEVFVRIEGGGGHDEF